MQVPKNNIYTVSRLNGEVRKLLEGELGKIWLSGEISNFAAPGSGHWYLTLKDSHSQIRCAMFKGRNQSVTFRPANGQQVLVRAAISVYEPRGDYQLIIESMLPAGDGMLAQQYEALKMQLAAQGLFTQDTKRPLPENIQRIGVITSPTGAAIRDVLHVLERRDPSIEVVIYPAQVQGEAATQTIINALDMANHRLEVDVLLLTRGGGSLEDLWCFNSENLAHAIYNSALPVVSAVGHEVDTTIADYVADVRAPTPSAGAELLSKDKGNKLQKLAVAYSRLESGWNHYQLKAERKHSQLQHRLAQQDPVRSLQQLAQRFDEMQLRLESALERRLSHLSMQQQRLTARLQQQSPGHRVAAEQNRLSYLSKSLDEAMTYRLEKASERLQKNAGLLGSVSPLATLSRGYSISSADGKVLHTAQEVKPGDELTTRLSEGELVSTVTQVKPRTEC
ncbi:exodeoxyribonuclease VII large subunit [Shewanella submarina]|uniref:Exodeoxyribonuclease 7 large subunit n=1 Tax=Shewanella submarina TaxID=2016376 RepID=A0ABV7GHB0_9GAMM|nr:exodeoxyribonuclease VII large subunit [Shewanella submarina]MCL1036403.1 exodeoxyribonuclease VII large subunit [Shewanella submarina]